MQDETKGSLLYRVEIICEVEDEIVLTVSGSQSPGTSKSLSLCALHSYCFL